MEQETPDEYPPGSDSTPTFAFGAALSPDQAYAGAKSLAVGGARYRLATFDNPTANHVWASPSQGAIRCKFRYTTPRPVGAMLFQITGKDLSGQNDTEDAIKLIIRPSDGFRVTYAWNNGLNTLYRTVTKAVAVDSWATAVVRWNTTSQTNKLSVEIDGTASVPTVSPIGNVACSAWHLLLIGNDTGTVPAGLWIDDFEVFDDWDMTIPAVN